MGRIFVGTKQVATRDNAGKVTPIKDTSSLTSNERRALDKVSGSGKKPSAAPTATQEAYEILKQVDPKAASQVTHVYSQASPGEKTSKTIQVDSRPVKIETREEYESSGQSSIAEVSSSSSGSSLRDQGYIRRSGTPESVLNPRTVQQLKSGELKIKDDEFVLVPYKKDTGDGYGYKLATSKAAEEIQRQAFQQDWDTKRALLPPQRDLLNKYVLDVSLMQEKAAAQQKKSELKPIIKLYPGGEIQPAPKQNFIQKVIGKAETAVTRAVTRDGYSNIREFYELKIKGEHGQDPYLMGAYNFVAGPVRGAVKTFNYVMPFDDLANIRNNIKQTGSLTEGLKLTHANIKSDNKKFWTDPDTYDFVATALGYKLLKEAAVVFKLPGTKQATVSFGKGLGTTLMLSKPGAKPFRTKAAGYTDQAAEYFNQLSYPERQKSFKFLQPIPDPSSSSNYQDKSKNGQNVEKEFHGLRKTFEDIKSFSKKSIHTVNAALLGGAGIGSNLISDYLKHPLETYTFVKGLEVGGEYISAGMGAATAKLGGSGKLIKLTEKAGKQTPLIGLGAVETYKAEPGDKLFTALSFASIPVAFKAAEYSLPRFSAGKVTIPQEGLPDIKAESIALQSPKFMEWFGYRGTSPVRTKVTSDGISETFWGPQNYKLSLSLNQNSPLVKSVRADLSKIPNAQGLEQPVTAAGYEVFNRLLKLTPEERMRTQLFPKIGVKIQGTEGMPVKDFTANIEGLKYPDKFSQILDNWMSKEGGIYYGSIITKNLPESGGIKLTTGEITKGFQNKKFGDIDAEFSTKTVEQLRPAVADFAKQLRAAGEDVGLSMDPATGQSLNIIEFSAGPYKGNKLFEAKSGNNQETLGLNDAAPAGIAGFMFNFEPYPFGKAQGISIGEQTLRKYAGALIVSPGKLPGETASFSGPGILGKQGNTRGLKDTAGAIQGTLGIAELKKGSWNPITRMIGKQLEKLGETYFDTYSQLQKSDLSAKLKDLIGTQELPLKVPLSSSAAASSAKPKQLSFGISMAMAADVPDVPSIELTQPIISKNKITMYLQPPEASKTGKSPRIEEAKPIDQKSGINRLITDSKLSGLIRLPKFDNIPSASSKSSGIINIDWSPITSSISRAPSAAARSSPFPSSSPSPSRRSPSPGRSPSPIFPSPSPYPSPSPSRRSPSPGRSPSLYSLLSQYNSSMNSRRSPSPSPSRRSPSPSPSPYPSPSPSRRSPSPSPYASEFSKLKKYPSLLKMFGLQDLGNAGFLVEIKKKGKWQLLANSPGMSFDLMSALSKGARAVAGNAAASFKVVGSNLPAQRMRDIYFMKNLQQFRQSKQKKGVFVEKSRFRINTPGELQQITARGIQNSRAARDMMAKYKKLIGGRL